MERIKQFLSDYALPLVLTLLGFVEQFTSAMSLFITDEWAGYIQKTMGILTGLAFAIRYILKLQKKRRIKKHING